MNNNYEKLLFQYYMALEREDLATIEQIWDIASSDTELTAQLLELDAELRQESSSPKIIQPPHFSRRTWRMVAAIFLFFIVGSWITMFSGDDGSDLFTEFITATDEDDTIGRPPLLHDAPTLVHTYETGFVADVAWSPAGTAVYNGHGVWFYQSLDIVPLREPRYVGFDAAVKHAMFNEDGSRLLVGLTNRDVLWVDVETLQVEYVKAVTKPIAQVDALNELVIMQNEDILRVDYLYGGLVLQARLDQGAELLRYDPLGRVLLYTNGDSLMFYDLLKYGDVLVPSLPQGETWQDIAVGPNGNRVVALTDGGNLYILNRHEDGEFTTLQPETAQIVHTLDAEAGKVSLNANRVGFTFDGEGLVIMYDAIQPGHGINGQAIEVWDNSLTKVQITSTAVHAIASPPQNWTATPDGIFMADTLNGVWLYDVKQNNFDLAYLVQIGGAQRDWMYLSRSYEWFDVSDNYVVARDAMLDFYVWDRATGDLIKYYQFDESPTLSNDRDHYGSMSLHPTQNIIYFTRYQAEQTAHNIVAWNFITNEETVVVSDILSNTFTLSSDGSQIVVNGTVPMLADTATGTIVEQPQLNRQYLVNEQFFLVDRANLLIAVEKQPAIFNLEAGEYHVIFSETLASQKRLTQTPASGVSFDGRWLAFIDEEGTYTVWDAKTLERISFASGFDKMNELHFSDDGNLLIVGTDLWINNPELRIIDTTTNQTFFTLSRTNRGYIYGKFAQGSYDLVTLTHNSPLTEWALPENLVPTEGPPLLDDESVTTPAPDVADENVPDDDSDIVVTLPVDDLITPENADQLGRTRTVGPGTIAQVLEVLETKDYWVTRTWSGFTRIDKLTGESHHLTYIENSDIGYYIKADVYADDNLLLVNSVDESTIWNLENGEFIELELEFVPPEDVNDRVYHFGGEVAFVDQGQYVAYGRGSLELMNLVTGENETLIADAPSNSALRTLIYSPINEFLAFSDEQGRIYIYDLRQRKITQTLIATSDFDVTMLTFSANGQYLAAVDFSRKLTVWRVADWEPVLEYQIYYDIRVNGGDTNLSMSPDGQLIILPASQDQPVQIMDVARGEIIADYGIAKDVGKFNLDGTQIIIGGEYSPLSIWNVSDATTPITIPEPVVVSDIDSISGVNPQAALDEFELLRTYDKDIVDKAINVLETKDYFVVWTWHGFLVIDKVTEKVNKSLQTVSVGEGLYAKADVYPDENLFVVNWRDSSILWNLETGEQTDLDLTLTLPEDADTRQYHIGAEIAFSADGEYVVYGRGSLETLNLRTGENKTLIEDIPTDSTLRTLAVHPDGRHLAFSAENGIIYIYDLVEREIVQELSEHSTYVVLMTQFSANGNRFASLGEDDRINVWDTTTWDLVTSYQLDYRRTLYSGNVHLSLASNGRYLILPPGDGKRVQIFDIASDAIIAEYGTPGEVGKFGHNDWQVLIIGQSSPLTIWGLAPSNQVIVVPIELDCEFSIYTAAGDGATAEELTKTTQFRADDDLNIVATIGEDCMDELKVRFVDPYGETSGDILSMSVTNDTSTIVLGLDWENQTGATLWPMGNWSVQIFADDSLVEILDFNITSQ